MLATRFSDRNRTAFTMQNPYYCADRETEFAMQPVRCVTGDAPTLAEVDAHFGRNTASEWIVPLLADLSIFTGAKNLDARQQKQLATIIAAEQRGLKVTEVMLFFYRFKTGRYGRFYGAVDPMVVTTALQDFLRERQQIIDQHQDEAAAEWDTEAQQRWQQMRSDVLAAMPGLPPADFYLCCTEPYRRRLLVSVASRKAEGIITQPDHWAAWQRIVAERFPEEFGEVKLRRAWSPVDEEIARRLNEVEGNSGQHLGLNPKKRLDFGRLGCPTGNYSTEGSKSPQRAFLGEIGAFCGRLPDGI